MRGYIFKIRTLPFLDLGTKNICFNKLIDNDGSNFYFFINFRILNPKNDATIG